MGKILVTGGAGYIGSHTAKALAAAGRDLVILDNLSTGHADFLNWGTFEEGDLLDQKRLQDIMTRHDVESVIHFASMIAVGESVVRPGPYYANNVTGTLNLLEAMRKAGVMNIVFSSSASVYGEPRTKLLKETHRLAPLSPYAWSKRYIEQVLSDYDRAYDMKSVSLRYFNAAGADPDCQVGERHIPETHLIPLILFAALGIRENIKIFGTDYDTPDGTCLRDYVHVNDLAQAHIQAVDHLEAGKKSDVFNLGNGNGFSVREVIDVARKVTGRDIKIVEDERRPGDSPALVAASQKVRKKLGWDPQFADLETIVETAWKWHLKDLDR